MGLLKKLQEQRKKEKRKEHVERYPRIEQNAIQSQADVDEIERRRKEQETINNAQQVEQARRIQEINDRVDQQTTTNSEEFLDKIKQPGGQ